MKQNILKNTLKECSKLKIAEGSLDMSYRFSNDIPEITDGDKYSPFVAIKQTLTHRNFIYNAVYKYNFKMDLSKIDTEIEDNNIIITWDDSSLPDVEFTIKIKDITNNSTFDITIPRNY